MSKPQFSRKRKGKKVDPYPMGAKPKVTHSRKSRRAKRGRPKDPIPLPPEQQVHSLEDELKRAKETGSGMQLCYHGTYSKEVAEKVLEEGFKDGTYFTPQMENAYAGGARPYVFEVAFCMDFQPRGGWQWVETGIVSQDRINALYVFDRPPLYTNSKVFNAVGEHNMEKLRRQKGSQ